MEAMAEAYYQYMKDQTVANFHGLRDYYALIKTLSKHERLDFGNICDAIYRTFGGLEDSAHKFIRILRSVAAKYKEDEIRPPPPSMTLVKNNLLDMEARHLMLIAHGDTALCLLRLPQLRKALNNPVVMLASPFKDDEGDEHAYQQLSKIILYMEAGQQVIIKDHDHIYGALYDMLNQNYTVHENARARKRFCRVALGDRQSPPCHVDDKFRCIMLEEAGKIEDSDPPRLNR